MLRDMKFLRRRNPDKNVERENLPVSPRALSSTRSTLDSSRAPLNSIQEQIQTARSEQEAIITKSKTEMTPVKSKESTLPARTPEKHNLGVSSRRRFGWAKSEVNEGFDDARADSTYYSVSSRGVAGNLATPRINKTAGRANSSYSEANSTQSTPTKSVSKPPPSVQFKCKVEGNGVGRWGNFSALYKGLPSSSGHSNIVNTVEVPHFDLKEDPSFWMDHNVQVLIRVRPLNGMERSLHGYNRCLKQENAQSISWIGQPETRFTFDHIACETIDQETLFRMVGLPMVENCLSGYNSCMFAYGQTGSGKTYTMLGEIEDLEFKPSPNRGMTPRIFEFLFARIQAEEESRSDERLKYNCKCSFLEIYNEQITDLLDPSSANLLLREDAKKGVYVENLTEFEVRTVGDILRLLIQGSSNRRVAATNMNRESSRSHSVFTCVIESRWEKDSTTNLRFARLNLVDLAGSERQKTSGAEGDRLKEAANINKSLSTLGHVIMVLVDIANGKNKHVPYRDSRLTFLLQDSLGGNSKTIIVANVSPSICAAAETLNTLKFAQRAKLIQNNAVVNEDSTGDVIALQRQIRLLKEELAALKRQNLSRPLSFGSISIDDDMELEEGLSENKNEDGQPRAVELEFEHKGVVRMSTKQLKSLETTLAGSLRREQMADMSVKQLEAQIEQLNRLVRQREDDNRCTKMMLKFREDKIQRMGSLVEGLVDPESYLIEENKALSEEIQLLQAKVDRNPEVTHFAKENIRLLDQLKRFQEFYEEGERELLLQEVSKLRDQLLEFINGTPGQQFFSNLSSQPQEAVHLRKENASLHLELQTTCKELEECRNNLQTCLKENAKLSRDIQDLHSTFEKLNAQENGLECEFKQKKDSLEEVLELQLELDILKVLVQEERTAKIVSEEQAISLRRDLEMMTEKVLSKSKLYEEASSDLNVAKSIIEALESEQVFSMNELEDLKNSNDRYIKLLNLKENEIDVLRNQLSSSSIKLRDQPAKETKRNEESPLRFRLNRMHESLEKAKQLNLWYQSDRVFQASNEAEMDQVRRQAEAETAEAIVCMQEELALLQQQVRDSEMKEIETEKKTVFLEHENKQLTDLLEAKNRELQCLSEEWNFLTGEIEEVLADGDGSLLFATNELEDINNSFPQRRHLISDRLNWMVRAISEKELVIKEMNSCLQEANSKINDLESMLKTLRGAAMVIAEAHQQECCEKENEIQLLSSQLDSKYYEVEKLEERLKLAEDNAIRASKCATVALVIVNRLSELNFNYRGALKQKDSELSELMEMILRKDLLLNEQAGQIERSEKQIEIVREALSGETQIANAIRQKECCEKENKIQLLSSQLDSKSYEVEKLEDGLKLAEDYTIKASKCATVAFIIVNRLSELNFNHLSELKQKNSELSELAEMIMSKDLLLNDQAVQIETSQKQIESLREMLAGETQLTNAMKQRLEDLEESNILQARQKIQELQSGVYSLRSCMSTYLGDEKHSKQMLDKEIDTFNYLVEVPEVETANRQENRIDSQAVMDTNSNDCDPSYNERNGAEWYQCKEECDSVGSCHEEFGRDGALLLMKREVGCAFESLKQLQAEMAELQKVEEGRLTSEKLENEKINNLAVQVLDLHTTMRNFEDDLNLRIGAFYRKIQYFERAVVDFGNDWCRVKESVEREFGDAEMALAEKSLEASFLLSKFTEAQETMKEANVLINGLTIANETLKLEVERLKKSETSLLKERDAFVVEIQSLQSINCQRDELLRSLEEQASLHVVETRNLFAEVEGIILELSRTSEEKFMMLSEELCSFKSNVFDSTRLVKSWLEEIWSEIIVRDCALSSLHLCHTGILLEVVTGLNTENGLLQHGLTKTNSLLSDLQEQNSRSRRELEAFRILEGKLLADIKNGFDRITRKEKEAVDLSCRINSFEKKIMDVQLQEEMMLQRSDSIGLQLAALTKELDLSNLSAAKLHKEEKEFLNSELEEFELHLCTKEFESVILAGEVEEIASLKVELIVNLEKLSREIICLKIDAELEELLLMEQECLISTLKREMEEKELERLDLSVNLNLSNLKILEMEGIIKTLQEDVGLLREVESLNSSLKVELHETTDTRQRLLSRIELLENEREKLQFELCKRDEELSKFINLMEKHDLLEREMAQMKSKNTMVLQDLAEKRSECESSLTFLDGLNRENLELKGTIGFLETSIADLKSDLEVKNDAIKGLRDSQSLLAEKLGEKTRDLRANEKLKQEILFHSSLNTKYCTQLVTNVDALHCSLLDRLDKKSLTIADKMFQQICEDREVANKFIGELMCLDDHFEGLVSENSVLRTELSRKDSILDGLLFDLRLLQESASNSQDQKEEIEKLAASLEILEDELTMKSDVLNEAVAHAEILEAQLQKKSDAIALLEMNLIKENESVRFLSEENMGLKASIEEALAAKIYSEEELTEQKKLNESLEMELSEMADSVDKLNVSVEDLKSNLDNFASEREQLQTEIVDLKEKLQKTQIEAETYEAVAIKAQEIAGARERYAQDREEEIKLLEMSVRELGSTVDALENKVDIVKGEAERQRLLREELETELQLVKNQMEKFRNADADMRMHLDEKKADLEKALNKIKILEQDIAKKDVEVSKCKDHISELNLHAEAQASEYKQNFKALQAMAEQVRTEVASNQVLNSVPQKSEKSSSKPRGSGSPFKCIGLGLAQQVKSEKDEELTSARLRIDELESAVANKQKEIFTLNAKLAAAESMTHDIIRDLLGVKLDVTSYMSLMHTQQEERRLEKAEGKSSEPQQIEVIKLKEQLNEFIKERQGWLNEMDQRQVELVAAQVALENLQLHEQLLMAENDMLKVDNSNYKKKAMELEGENLRLSGQQNLQQRIHHHAKIKEENNVLKIRNEELSNKLRRAETILSRVKEELARYRASVGRTPYLNVDGEHLLNNKLQETEEERVHLEHKLLRLCTSVLKVAGFTRPISHLSPSMVEEALEQLKNKLDSLEIELEDLKTKNKIYSEKIRLFELMPQQPSPPVRSHADENLRTPKRTSHSSFLSPLDR
ncbi:hypothetical protein SAY86_017165 [Trapa natans]|uniref:Kinesin motor domain-containing protein n=1 Tax=Trapa natans TaxID=22666 RepID=A0AAN7M4S2_TRANT|nr:hypothetical protein SAY86_017165 [Trapa natans]